MNDFRGTDVTHLRRALELAAEAARGGDVPVGAVLVAGERAFEAQNEK
jgi:tRNA(Arg) A34 adenosine deaminase TadA